MELVELPTCAKATSTAFFTAEISDPTHPQIAHNQDEENAIHSACRMFQVCGPTWERRLWRRKLVGGERQKLAKHDLSKGGRAVSFLQLR